MKLGVCAAILLGALACGPSAPGARNVVLVSIDTLRPDMLGSYGYPRDTSPALDTLAREGVRFETALAPSPWTLPSHASLLTGLYPRHHGLKSHDRRFADDVALWAPLLRAQGFATAAVVNSLYLSRRAGFDRGFDAFDYQQESLDRRTPSDVGAAGARWIAARGDERFFLFLHLYDVHSDYTSLDAFERAFTRPYGGAIDGSTAQLLRFRQGQLEIGPRDRDHLVDLYVAGIRQVDDEIGKLVGALRRKGVFDDTLLIVTSDHGEEFLEHGGVLHGRTQYDELLRVPLILRGPGLPPGRVVDTPVSLVDVLPTALGLLDVGVPNGLDGRDVAPLLRDGGGDALRGRTLFGEADHNNAEDDVTRSARSGSFKLVFDRISERYRLYDLEADPGEQQDAIARHPERAEALAAELERFVQGGASAEALPPLGRDDVERLKALGYM